MYHKLGMFVFSAVVGACLIGDAQAAQIIGSVNENSWTTLGGNINPGAIPANDQGAIPGNTKLNGLELLLRIAPAKQKALDKFVVQLNDKRSTDYHKWISAKQFGNRFGADDADIAKVTKWLDGKGLKVNSVSAGKTFVMFSGSAEKVQGAFHADIHNIVVDGVRHYANMKNPQIPANLMAAVAGVVSLTDFYGHTNYQMRPKKALTGGNCFVGTCLFVTPSDLATIYNLKPLHDAGIAGKGQTIVVVEDSAIGLESTQAENGKDWTTFRKTMGLSGFTHGKFTQGQVGPGCSDPGINSNEGEATLDAEWASAAAPDAHVQMVSCADAGVNGVLLAVQNELNSPNPAPIISESFGLCETEMGATENASFAATYEQGVAEGTTIFVSSGDESATSCDANQRVARHGITVSGFASTPYNVAVGGTDFGDIAAQCKLGQNIASCDKKYWSASNSAVFGSAKSYMPEIPWNSSCGSTLFAAFVTGSAVTSGRKGFCNSVTAIDFGLIVTGSGSGGPSGCSNGQPLRPDVVSGSCAGYAKPAFQAGAFGNPSDGVRDIPDVSLFAANGVWDHSYIFCDSNGGACGTDPLTWGKAGGTSFSSPIMAGIMALVEQKVGSRQGMANTVFYALGAAEYGASGNANCNSTLGAKVAKSCVFNDVTEGDFDVPCVGSNNCFDPSGAHGVTSVSDKKSQPAYVATRGWDFTTGLGTVNAANLVKAWPR